MLGLITALTRPVLAQCTSDEECNDNLFCTIDTCNTPGPGGVCINRVRTCSDDIYCNGDEQCDETRDLCEFACLGGGTCSGGFCVGGSNPGTPCDAILHSRSCPTGLLCNESLNACTECVSNADCPTEPNRICRPGFGVCVECLEDSRCVDGLYCNGTETCDEPSGSCVAGVDVQCTFGQFCSGNLDRCVECEFNSDCNDGFYCNGTETCSNDLCVPGTSINCAAIDPSKPYCQEDTDSCVQCLNSAQCDDSAFCTTDNCDLLGQCQNIPDPGTFCDDGNDCNGVEDCSADLSSCVAGTPMNCGKACFRGLTPGATCTGDAQCGKSCVGGPNDGLSCTSDSNCGRACLGGPDDGVTCTQDDECSTRNCAQVGLCVPGACRGGCSPSVNGGSCVQCAADVPGSTTCSDNLFCDGTETCNASHQCVGASRPTCSQFNADCTKGACNENSDACVGSDRAAGTICDDLDHCTRFDECAGGACVEDTPAAGDVFRCLDISIAAVTTGSIKVGNTVQAKLTVKANGCNTPNTRCPAGQMPIGGLSAILNWDPAYLELKPSTSGDRNPLDPCDSGDPCFACPAGQYNWGESTFASDCGPTGDALNSPCSGTPTNDGNAIYTAVPQNQCNGEPAPACISSSGLYVTNFKFKVLARPADGTAEVSLDDCAGNRSLTEAIAGVVPPTGYVPSYAQDATRSVSTTPAAFSVVNCVTSLDCSDGNNCTSDICSSGVCINVAVDCTSPDACLIGSCNAATGACQFTPVSCPSGQRCYQGSCFRTCLNALDCNDNVSCTDDTCEAVSGDDICRNTPNDAHCATGLFCAAQRCDAVLGCIADHECVPSGNGNPCLTPGSCNESNDTCGGCLTPTAVASGSRYLKITPPNQGTTPIALMIRGDCNDSAVGCVEKYVQSTCKGGTNDGNSCTGDANCPKACDGGTRSGLGCTIDTECTPLGSGFKCVGSCSGNALGGTPMYRTAAAWGAFLQVTGMQILPGTNYLVVSQCNFAGGAIASAATEATTWKWGDATGEGSVNVFDISATVDIIKLTPTSGTYEGSNVWPCDIDRGNVNVLDLASFVDAVKGKPFPCAAICP